MAAQVPSLQLLTNMLDQLLRHVAFERPGEQAREDFLLRFDEADADVGRSVQRFEDGAADGDRKSETIG